VQFFGDNCVQLSVVAQYLVCCRHKKQTSTLAAQLRGIDVLPTCQGIAA
jgi:hypothetical protein